MNGAFVACEATKAPFVGSGEPVPRRRRGPRVRASASDRPRWSAPDVAGDGDDEVELGALLVGGQVVALDRGGEAALRGEAELLERHVLRRLLDAALEGVGVLELAGLGGDEAQDHLLVAAGQEAQGR